MQLNGGRVRRGVISSIIVAAGCAAFGAGSASATITQTAITSPSNPFIYAFNGDASPSPTVTVTGTTNSDDPTNDQVRILCSYNRQGGGLDTDTIASGIPLNSDGTFSAPITIDPTNFGFSNALVHTCTLHAVPESGGYSDLSLFTGPLAELDYFGTSDVNGPGTPQYDYLYSSSGTAGGASYTSSGDCGLSTQAIKPLSEAYGDEDWQCSASLPGSNLLSGRSTILIDGRNAYDSYAANYAYRDSNLGEDSGQAAGFPALTSSFTRSNDVTGNATGSESEALVSCADASYPATQAKCGGVSGSSLGTWQSDGVSLARTFTQSANGSQETVTDTFTSTDGQAHGIDLQYVSSGFGDYKFPGQADYQEFSPGDVVIPAGASQDAIMSSFQSSSYDQNLTQAGALIYSTQPDSAQFNDDGGLLLQYRRAVPAGGSIAITQTYITGYNAAATDAAVNTVLDQTHKPTVSITAPAANAVTSLNLALVRGTAAAHDGLGLKVDGQTVTVNPDGTWSTTVALNQGKNTVTAVASDGSGNLAQAAETVTYTPTPAPKFCIVPDVSKNKLAKAKTALKKADCKVGKISKVRSAKFKKGTVEHASYSAHVVLKAGTKVGLTEVIGKPKAKKKKTTRHFVRR